MTDEKPKRGRKPKELDKKSLGARVRKARESRGFTTEVVASYLGVTNQMISAGETSKGKFSNQLLIGLAHELGDHFGEQWLREHTEAWLPRMQAVWGGALRHSQRATIPAKDNTAVSDERSKLEVSHFSALIPAGFPSPAEEYAEERLDLNRHLIRTPSSAIIYEADDDLMKGEGIFKGDVVISSRAIAPIPGKVVLVSVDGEETLIIRRLVEKKGELYLGVSPEDASRSPIKLAANMHIIGVVTANIRRH